MINKITLKAKSKNPTPYSSSHNHPVSLSVACQIVRAAEEARNPFKELSHTKSRKVTQSHTKSHESHTRIQHPKREGGTNCPSNTNLRGFRSSESMLDIINIRTDLVIKSFDRRSQNNDEEMDTGNLY